MVRAARVNGLNSVAPRVRPEVTWTVFFVAAAALAPAALAQRTPSFRGIGYLPGHDFQSVATDVSADGSVVVGKSSAVVGDQAFRWTSAAGIQPLEPVAGAGVTSVATGVSADGNVVVGYRGSTTYRAFRWTSGGGMQDLGVLLHPDHANDLSNTYSMPYDVSADGNVVVGRSGGVYGSSEAFRWTAAEGMRGLGDLGSGTRLDSLALGVSADGSTVVGRASADAFRWTAAGGMQRLPLPGIAIGPSLARGVNADGTVVTGSFPYQSFGENDDDYLYHDFLWTQGGGSRQLPAISAYAVSADGSMVFGVSGNDAAVWTATGGVQRLKDLLQQRYGLDLTGWTLNSALDVSADGSTIVGGGHNPAGQIEGWVATVPEPSSALALLAVAVPAALRRRRARSDRALTCSRGLCSATGF